MWGVWLSERKERKKKGMWMNRKAAVCFFFYLRQHFFPFWQKKLNFTKRRWVFPEKELLKGSILRKSALNTYTKQKRIEAQSFFFPEVHGTSSCLPLTNGKHKHTRAYM